MSADQLSFMVCDARISDSHCLYQIEYSARQERSCLQSICLKRIPPNLENRNILSCLSPSDCWQLLAHLSFNSHHFCKNGSFCSFGALIVFECPFQIHTNPFQTFQTYCILKAYVALLGGLWLNLIFFAFGFFGQLSDKLPFLASAHCQSLPCDSKTDFYKRQIFQLWRDLCQWVL